MKCFFHSADLDGFCSAAIVKHRFPNAYLVGINYGQPFHFNKIYKNETIYMVDFCLVNDGEDPMADMKKLLEITPNVHLIDHHKSAIIALKNGGLEDLPGLREKDLPFGEKGRAGCELTWEYIYPNIEMPLGVKLLGRYDVFDLSDERTLEFQYGSRLYDTYIKDNSVYWRHILSDDAYSKEYVNEVIEKGSIVYQYEQQTADRYAKSFTYVKEFMGARALVMNKGYANSLHFKAVYDPELHDIMIAYSRRADVWSVSIYSAKPEFPANEIAEQFTYNGKRGGGHMAASGFQIEDISPLLP